VLLHPELVARSAWDVTETTKARKTAAVDEIQREPRHLYWAAALAL